jgi:hypothetical protein
LATLNSTTHASDSATACGTRLGSALVIAATPATTDTATVST